MYLSHKRGVAARALHVHKEVESFGGKVAYTVVLEGICRFSVKNLETSGPYCVATVTQLDCTDAGEDKTHCSLNHRVVTFLSQFSLLFFVRGKTSE